MGGQSSAGRSRPAWCALLSTALLLLLVAPRPSLAEDWDVMPDSDIAGPVVKSASKHEGDIGTDDANGEEKPAEAPLAPKKSIAEMIDEALEKEFPLENEADVGKNYNETAKKDETMLETVVKVSTKQKEKVAEVNTTVAEGASEGGEGHNASTPPHRTKAKLDQPVEQEIDILIDSQDNEYVLSRPKEQGMGLTLDPQLIRDMTVVVASSAGVGLGMEALRQPVINGYFIAGSLVGPGGLQWVKELVQVQSVAQLGVSLLLFTLGLEFSLAKLRVVRGVALLGGLLEVVLMSILSGVFAKLIGGRPHEGIFTGMLVAMSSTSIVVKCLTDTKSNNTSMGQITIGTLILQDCLVGLIFAFMPLLASATGAEEVDKVEVALLILKVLAKLLATMVVAIGTARVLLQPTARVLAGNATPELYQLSLCAFCLLCAMVTGYLGLSTELGAFIGGVMLATTDQQEHALHAIENIKQVFVALFIASTGLILSPVFLLQHLPVLTAGLFLVVVTKTLLFSFVVWIFGYGLSTCVAVGLSMAQIGEFAFVLLSIARSLHIIQHQLYMLLMGVTALSLLITPSLLQVGRWLLSDGGAAVLESRLKCKRSGAVACDEVEVDKEASCASTSGNSPLRLRQHDNGGGFSTVSQGGLQQRNAPS